MAEAFLLDTKIISCPTIRNDDGLPLSLRNNRLNQQELKKASLFSKLLKSNLTDEEVIARLKEKDFTVDYIKKYENRHYGAVWLNNIRLIDNIRIS